jgi:serine/threonine protein kinase
MPPKSKVPEKIGQYDVQDCIGKGSMGEIWLCHDSSLDRMIVVKRMQLALRGYEDLVQRFNREVQVLAAMNHPNIVNVYGYWMEKGQLNLSMEFVNGWNLRQILDRTPVPPVWVTGAVLRETLDALMHVHAKGFVHRDLKPGNIMVDFAGRSKLLDFGIARVVSQEMTLPGTVIGTTAYMSPEQVRGLSATPQSDLFSLGIIAFEMLTGRHPFRGENVDDTSSNILNTRVGPAQFPAEVPAGLRNWVCTLLSKEPSKRPGSAHQAMLALDSVLEGLPRELTVPLAQWLRAVRKELPSPPPPLWRHTLPPVAWLGGAAGAGLVLGLLLTAIF